MRLVVVGSTNPVKIAAAHEVVQRVWPTCMVRGVPALSGVPDQPIGDEQTRRGARARAQQALDSDATADLGIGIEGGVVRDGSDGLRTCAWAAVVDRWGTTCDGGSLSMVLPTQVAELVLSGTELGHAMDEVARSIGTKHGRGAVGILTAGLIDRQRAYEPLVTYALVRWLAPDYFAGSGR